MFHLARPVGSFLKPAVDQIGGSVSQVEPRAFVTESEAVAGTVAKLGLPTVTPVAATTAPHCRFVQASAGVPHRDMRVRRDEFMFECRGWRLALAR
jgi:hypothetical protein